MHTEDNNNLFKIISTDDWEKSQKLGYVPLSSFDQDFVHLATASQVEHVADKFWSGKEYYLLTVDTNKILGELKLEINPGGQTKYFHLYYGEDSNPIPLSAIKAVKLFSLD